MRQIDAEMVFIVLLVSCLSTNVKTLIVAVNPAAREILASILYSNEFSLNKSRKQVKS